MSKHVSPDDVPSQDAILVAFWWWLPLNHDGLVGAATGNDILRRSAGRLFWKRDPGGEKVNTSNWSTDMDFLMADASGSQTGGSEIIKRRHGKSKG